MWCLNYELKRQRRHRGMENLPPLMKAIISGWKPDSPVDSLVLSHELELMGRQPVNELISGRLNKRRRSDWVAGYDRFLRSSLAGEKPGLGEDEEQPRATRRSLEDFNRLTVEVVEPAKYKIDGKGPFTAKEARAEVVRVAGKKKSVLLMLKVSSDAMTDEEYTAFKESLQADGGMLDGLDIQGIGEFRQGFRE